ncbi:hypothetical protein [Rhizobium sp. Kim5]|uniref:hypothetical protein n=1 Tax=Rhizobium sp. Kim5 TaxID=2020311 RepID=UPI0001908340|nr:hypothetical protein [Rhizobium sp. Kim5]
MDGAISAAVFLFAQAADAGKADKLVKELLSELAAAILATHPSKNFDLAESRRKIAARLAFRKVDDHKRFVAAGRRVKRKAPAA